MSVCAALLPPVPLRSAAGDGVSIAAAIGADRRPSIWPAGRRKNSASAPLSGPVLDGTERLLRGGGGRGVPPPGKQLTPAEDMGRLFTRQVIIAPGRRWARFLRPADGETALSSLASSGLFVGAVRRVAG